MVVSKQDLEALALSEKEYEAIVERLGREPNQLELGMFGSMWSEHCGYKHSKPLIQMFNTNNPRLLVSAGEENAGVVDIGDDMAVVFKIESHNHPSAIEPYEGAATGVGGIVRDIIAMGARPIALLNSLRFGPISESRNRYLFNGVVSGISGYGNCIGIPDVGGEIVFSDKYSGNPLVNAMCVGLLHKSDLIRATTGTAGNVLMLVGSQTGRDGIHGASGLASRTFEDERELRPAVQVSNPFLEKILIEACLEVAKSGHAAGLQDLGAAGLTSATIEAASNGNSGFELDVSKVKRRDNDMTPYEVMLSESQERMLVIVKEGEVDPVKAIFDKWDVESTIIGRVIDGDRAKIIENGDLKGDLPISILNDPPLYRLNGEEPKWQNKLQEFDLSAIPVPEETPDSILKKLLGSPNIASKSSIFTQYDHQVQTNTVVAPGADAAVLRIKGTTKGLALCTDGNGKYCYLDPKVGGMIAVAEACRNISVMGAQPIALTNCLNFGNPERPEIYFQLEECVKGMSEASKVFDAPIISGNVSLYNETHGEAIYPTPIVGALGLLDDVTLHLGPGFVDQEELVAIIGVNDITGVPDSIGGSEYLEIIHGQVVGRPTLDMELELAVQKTCILAAERRILVAAHDCSEGGLAVALAELCMQNGVGFKYEAGIEGRWDWAVFGEVQSRIIVSMRPEKLDSFRNVCADTGVPWIVIGRTTGDSLVIPNMMDVKVEELKDVWMQGLSGRG